MSCLGKAPRSVPVGDPTYEKYLNLRKRVALVANPCHFRPFSRFNFNFFLRAAISSHLKWWTSILGRRKITVVHFDMFQSTQMAKKAIFELMHFFELGKPQFSARKPLFNLKFSGPYAVRSTDDKNATDSTQSSLAIEAAIDYEKYKQTQESEYADVWAYFDKFSLDRELLEVKRLGVKVIEPILPESSK